MSIRSIEAMEILDSRGLPTLRVSVTLDNGIRASASVPSGASTGEHEAHELRDNDPKRYGGKGVRKACSNVNDIIAPVLLGRDVREQAALDHAMIELDGTPIVGGQGELRRTAARLTRGAHGRAATTLSRVLPVDSGAAVSRVSGCQRGYMRCWGAASRTGHSS